MHELARIAFESSGWEMLGIESGADAVAAGTAGRPDAVLLDVEMPGLDGPATLAVLRRTPATAGLPVIFLTGHDDAETRARLMSLDVSGIVSKPFEITTLTGQIAAVLRWAP